MAIVAVPLLVLCFGITELGRAVYQYNGLIKATRGAARYLSQQNVASPAVGDTAADIRLRARSLALCGSLACGTEAPLVPNLTLAMIDVCDAVSCPDTHANISTGEGTTSLVSVTIGNGQGQRYVFHSLLPWLVPDLTFSPVGITMAASTN